MRGTAGYSPLDHRRNYSILEEHRADRFEKKLAQYKQNWLNRISRMEDIPRTIYSEAILIKHLLVSDYPEQEMHQTDFYQCGLYYRFCLNILISLVVS
jgi:hypothetical protein